jgi:hypothetical protein
VGEGVSVSVCGGARRDLIKIKKLREQSVKLFFFFLPIKYNYQLRFSSKSFVVIVAEAQNLSLSFFFFYTPPNNIFNKIFNDLICFLQNSLLFITHSRSHNN